MRKKRVRLMLLSSMLCFGNMMTVSAMSGETEATIEFTERLAPGTYQVSVEMRERETNRTWSFTDSFTVTDEEAAHIQERVEEPVVQQSGFLNRDMTLPIVGICLLLSIGYILYLRRRLRSA